jgi:hypothetical protein
MAGITRARFLSSPQVIIAKDGLSLPPWHTSARTEAWETAGSFLRSALFAVTAIDLCSPGESSRCVTTGASEADVRKNLLSIAFPGFRETTAANCTRRSRGASG